MKPLSASRDLASFAQALACPGGLGADRRHGCGGAVAGRGGVVVSGGDRRIPAAGTAGLLARAHDRLGGGPGDGCVAMPGRRATGRSWRRTDGCLRCGRVRGRRLRGAGGGGRPHEWNAWPWLRRERSCATPWSARGRRRPGRTRRTGHRRGRTVRRGRPTVAAPEPSRRISSGRRIRGLTATAPDLDALERAGRADVLAGEAQLETYVDGAVQRREVAAVAGWCAIDRPAGPFRTAERSGGRAGPHADSEIDGSADSDRRRAAGSAAPSRTLVRTYGTVPYRDIDPTIWAGLAYVVMFGMMFGDVGHGMLLCLGAVLIRLGWIRRFPSLKPMWMFVAAAGYCGGDVRCVVRRILRTNRGGAGVVACAPGRSAPVCCLLPWRSVLSCWDWPTPWALSIVGERAA